MKISSPAFKNGCIIPSRYTCEGANINPPLAFADIPPQTKSLVLIMDDPDVPRSIHSDGIFDHWLIFNISPTTTQITESQSKKIGLGGKNTLEHTGYVGPCPPDREHRYFFKLFALDITLSLKEGARKNEIEAAMKGHVIDQAELMGRYEKGKGY